MTENKKWKGISDYRRELSRGKREERGERGRRRRDRGSGKWGSGGNGILEKERWEMGRNSLERLKTGHGPRCSCNSPRPAVTNLVPIKTAGIRKDGTMRHHQHSVPKTHVSDLRRGWPRRLSQIDRARVSLMPQSSKLSYQTGTAIAQGGEGRGREGKGGGLTEPKRLGHYCDFIKMLN